MEKSLFNLSTSIKKVETIYIFPELESRKHFHASGMSAINLLPRNYPKKLVFRRKSEKKIFALKRTSTLIFRVKLNFSCSENARNRFFAQKLPYKVNFQKKNGKKFFLFVAHLIRCSSQRWVRRFDPTRAKILIYKKLLKKTDQTSEKNQKIFYPL